MKYEITKGSEKDFEGAPEWATMKCCCSLENPPVIKERNVAFTNGTKEGCSWVRDGGELSGVISDSGQWSVIAERRPITDPVWSGEGLPPVGVECEGLFPRHPGNSFEWQDCLVLYVFEHECAVKSKGASTLHYCDQFRPVRSAEDVARDEAIEAMREALGHAAGLIEVRNIYRAIAAGKIPGVKLE